MQRTSVGSQFTLSWMKKALSFSWRCAKAWSSVISKYGYDFLNSVIRILERYQGIVVMVIEIFTGSVTMITCSLLRNQLFFMSILYGCDQTMHILKCGQPLVPP